MRWLIVWHLPIKAFNAEAAELAEETDSQSLSLA